MTDTKDAEENTQPINITIPIAGEGDVGIEPDYTERNVAIPDWLLDFSSQLNQPGRVEPAIDGDGVANEANPDEEEEADFSAPINLETSEWQSVQAEIDKTELPGHEPVEIKVLQLSDLDDLLDAGEYIQAAELISTVALNEETRQEVRKKLRPHLTLRDESNVLWEIYDHLNTL